MEQELERARGWYKFYVFGYVVMPEHVHLLVSEPEEGILAGALQILKQTVSRKLPHAAAGEPFWQPRYYDFNVVSEHKWKEKLNYIHYNPVTRGLVNDPADWHWSSYRHWQTGEMGTVEIESQWTFRLREKAGIPCTFKHRTRKDAMFPARPTLSPKTGDEDGAPMRPSQHGIAKSGTWS